MSETVLVTLITAIAGVIATFSAWFISRGKTKSDFVIQFQEAVQKDLQGWKEEARAYKEEAKKFRDEGYALRNDLERMTNRAEDLERENKQLHRDVEQLTTEVGKLKETLKTHNINGV